MFFTTFLGNKLINNSNYYKLPNETKYIIVGNSHSECAYNDSLIGNLTNLANSGESYFYTYLKIKKIISSNRQITTVFIEYTNKMIEKTFESWIFEDSYLQIRIPTYLPLMGYPDFNLFLTNNRMVFLKSLPKSIMKNIGHNYKHVLFEEKGFIKEARFGGYLFLMRNSVDSLINNAPTSNPDQKTKIPISELHINYLVKIIEFCKLNNVKVYLIRSPLHPKYPGLDNERLFRELPHQQFSNTEFLDFKDFPIQNSGFADLEHLNAKGARVYSIFFNQLLNRNLLDRNDKQEFINKEISEISH